MRSDVYITEMHAHPGKGMKSLQVAARKQGFEGGTRDEKPTYPVYNRATV
jgi:hypothetical protein